IQIELSQNFTYNLSHFIYELPFEVIQIIGENAPAILATTITDVTIEAISGKEERVPFLSNVLSDPILASKLAPYLNRPLAALNRDLAFYIQNKNSPLVFLVVEFVMVMRKNHAVDIFDSIAKLFLQSAAIDLTTKDLEGD